MRNDAVALHLAKTKTTVPRAPVCWLTCEGDNRTTSARVHLIVNQMAQALIVGWTEENFCVDNDTFFL
jgi:hypothetical protein